MRETITWATARRAGIRRSLARLRRNASLGWINPVFGARLYPSRRLAFLPDGSRIPLPASQCTCQEWIGSISLLNTELFPVRPPVDWAANPNGHALWAFELHQFEWAWPLVALAASGSGPAACALGDLLADYIEHVPFGAGAAWEPYPLSRRLVVWSAAWSVLRCCGYDTGRLAGIGAEIDRGARLLAWNIERDLDNNHVIANARALAYAGTLLGGDGSPTRYGRTGYALLWKQLAAQVLPDGGHIERSPHYHFLVWRDAVETALLAQTNAVDVPAGIIATLARMRDWLLAIRRPDGTFPLLSDSVADTFDGFADVDQAARRIEQGTPDPREQREIEGGCHGQILPDSGYAILQTGQTWVLFDAGPFGARHCPGHGHADALSFELWAEGQLLIADPGVFQYEPGPPRDYFRGTAAHSTLVVDGENQTEIAGSFRVGRMARASLKPEQTDRLPLVVRGSHDGYARLREPVIHRRALVLPHRHKLVLEDEILGTGEHDLELVFHLAPCLDVSTRADSVVVTYNQGIKLHVQWEAPSSAERRVEEGWYSPSWYTRQPAPALHLRWRGRAPCRVATTITITREVE